VNDAPAKKRGAKLKPIDRDKVEQLAALGLTQNEIAHAIGIHPATWYSRIASGESDILEAYKKGKGKHATVVFGGLAKAAAGGNVSALIFLAKSHFGRRENILHTHQGDPDGAPIRVEHDVTKLTPEQRAARIKELEAKRKREE
jgi:transcriptional regulator with XRE-family HTH domain